MLAQSRIDGHYLRVSSRLLLFWCANFILVTVPSNADAQSGSLAGSVVDSAGTPIAGATVLIGTRRTASTDRGGKFTIRDVPPGRHIVLVALLGFAADTVEAIVQSDETTTVSVR